MLVIDAVYGFLTLESPTQSRQLGARQLYATPLCDFLTESYLVLGGDNV